jgi:RNA-binding protein
MDTLTEAEKKHLKGKAHHLKPVVMIGQHGMKDTVMDEINKALTFHQMIKIKISGGDKTYRHELVDTISSEADALPIQQIGNVAVLYKRNRKKPSLLDDM